jgi:hypothetical protein
MKKVCSKYAEGKEVCKLVKEACEDMYCTPFCLRDTWNVKVTGVAKFLKNEFTGQDETQFEGQISNSLAAQVMGYGCEVVLKCCEEGNYVKNWVEDISYKNRAPMTLQQSLPGCHAPFQNEEVQKELCDDCKKAVKIEAKESKCNEFGDFNMQSFPDKNAGKDNKKSGAKDVVKGQEAKFLEVEERQQAGQKALELVSTHMSSEWVKKRVRYDRSRHSGSCPFVQVACFKTTHVQCAMVLPPLPPPPPIL